MKALLSVLTVGLLAALWGGGGGTLLNTTVIGLINTLLPSPLWHWVTNKLPCFLFPLQSPCFGVLFSPSSLLGCLLHPRSKGCPCCHHCHPSPADRKAEMSEDASVASDKSADQLWKGINMIGGTIITHVHLLTTEVQWELGAGREGTMENRSCLGRSPWGKDGGGGASSSRHQFYGLVLFCFVRSELRLSWWGRAVCGGWMRDFTQTSDSEWRSWVPLRGPRQLGAGLGA